MHAPTKGNVRNLSLSLQNSVKIDSFINKESVRMKIQRQSVLSIRLWKSCDYLLFLLLFTGLKPEAPRPRDPVTSSTARTRAPTVAQCPACLSACAARGKPGLDPCSQWSRQKSGQSCAPSRGPFRWPSLAPRAAHRIRNIVFKMVNWWLRSFNFTWKTELALKFQNGGKLFKKLCDDVKTITHR